MKKLIISKNLRIRIAALVCVCVVFFPSCKKLVELDAPKNALVRDVVFNNDVAAISYINGIYVSLSSSNPVLPQFNALNSVVGLSSDELSILPNQTSIVFQAHYRNELATVPAANLDLWSCFYHDIIYPCNNSIEALNTSTGLSTKVKTQLLGEVKFMRALAYSYMVSLYGDVPLVLGTDYHETARLGRTPQDQIWSFIIKDLEEAKKMLSANYLDATLENTTADRIRPTKWVATALLARSYLSIGDYLNAELQASEVIENISLYNLESITNSFVKNNKEAIFQLQGVTNTANTQQGAVFILPETGPVTYEGVGSFFINPLLIESFEPGDVRKNNWIGKVTVAGETYFYPFKYKIGISTSVIDDVSQYSEYSTVFRLAEQYLIRAEARIMQGGSKIAQGIQDINGIRARARAAVTVSVPDPLPAISTDLSQTLALDKLIHERQVELFTEWGDRWFTLKRTRKINAVMPSITASKGGIWQNYQALYPIPDVQIKLNPNLMGHQNPGYTE